jgi:Holliday junction resolvase RusA-like endonuclease
MKILIKTNPIPAKRMTQKSMWYGDAKKYVKWKNSLAEELKLHFLGTVKGGIIEVKEKWDKKDLPEKSLLSLNADFYRENNYACDLDNLIKSSMDLLQTAGIIKNDTQIRKIKADMILNQGQGHFLLELNRLQ